MFEFNEFKSLLKNKLNITDQELNEYNNNFRIVIEKIKDIDVGNLYDNSNLSINNKGIYYQLNGIRWKGFVYIKDGYVKPHYDKILRKLTFIPRFHIVECGTIMSMKFNNMYNDRYVFCNIPVKMTDKIDGKESDLYICNNCLKVINEEKLNIYTTTQIFYDLFLKNYSKDITTFKILHNPLLTSDFLKNFRYNPNLKIFTHKTDDTSIYKRVYKDPEIINNFLNEYKTKINPKTISLIKKFIPDDNQTSLPIQIPFMDETIELTWRSEQVKQKILEDNKNPLGTFSYEMRISGISFPKEIEKFKYLIEIRNDNKAYTFDKILGRYFEKKFEPNSFKIEKKIIPLRNSIFVDLYNFFSGLEIIVDWIRKYKHISNKVSIYLSEQNKDGNLILKIIHENSRWQKKINKDNLLGGDMEELVKYLFCIADLTITTQDTSNTSYQINLLKKDVSYLEREKNKDNDKFSMPEIIKLDSPIKGVIYELVIYDSAKQ